MDKPERKAYLFYSWTLNLILLLWSVYVDFCRRTTLHGLKYTVAPNAHWFERLVWLTTVISAIIVTIGCCDVQFQRYMAEPVVVSLQRDYRSWMTNYPAVTACFQNRIDWDKARVKIENNWNVTEESDPTKYEYYKTFIKMVTDVSFRSNLQNFWRYQNDETLTDVDLLSIATEVYPLTYFDILMPAITQKRKTLMPVMTEMGLCLTFNSAYSKYQFFVQNGFDLAAPDIDLVECHYLNRKCQAKFDSINRSLTFFIHSPYDVPDGTSNPTQLVSPGEELQLNFKVLQILAEPGIKHLHVAQRKCKYPEEAISSKIPAYSYGLCQMYCRSKLSLMFCGCRPFFHVLGDGRPCDAKGMACVARNMEILINLPKNFANCSCVPQCTELNYFVYTKKVMFWSGSGGSTSTLRCSLMPPKYRLHRDVIFTFEDLLASFGGTAAFFIGSSVLTAIETIFFVYYRLLELVMYVSRSVFLAVRA